MATSSASVAVAREGGQQMRPTVQIDSDAWRAGFEAGETGRAMTPCPANLNPFSYFSGWIEGHAKRRGYEYSAGAKR